MAKMARLETSRDEYKSALFKVQYELAIIRLGSLPIKNLENGDWLYKNYEFFINKMVISLFLNF